MVWGNLKLFFSPPFDVFTYSMLKTTIQILIILILLKNFTYLFQNDNKYYSSLIVSILIISLLRLLFFYSIFTFDKKICLKY